MGRTSRSGSLAAPALVALVALAACSGGGGDDDATTAEAPAEEAAAVADERAAPTGVAGVAEGGAGGDTAGTPLPSLDVDGQSIAIEARATVEATDVRAAVDRVTTFVTDRGGRVGAADIDLAPAGAGEDQSEARATLVLEVPPTELAAVVDVLDDVGEVRSFEQLAEDVSEQLADLDSRIANARASVVRVRGLLDGAADLDDVVLLESELTRRETELERLLAAQRQLDERVAMATLTVEIDGVAPGALDDAPDDRSGVVDALADGWSALVGVGFAIVFVLAVAAPFVAAALALTLIGLWIRRTLTRSRPTPPAAPAAPPVPADESDRQPATASRPE